MPKPNVSKDTKDLFYVAVILSICLFGTALIGNSYYKKAAKARWLPVVQKINNNDCFFVQRSNSSRGSGIVSSYRCTKENIVIVTGMAAIEDQHLKLIKPETPQQALDMQFFSKNYSQYVQLCSQGEETIKTHGMQFCDVVTKPFEKISM